LVYDNDLQIASTLVVPAVNTLIRKLVVSLSLAFLLLIVATPANAFRCGNRIVIEGMREVEVIAFCGEPSSRRHIGYAIKVHLPRGNRQKGLLTASRYGNSGYQQEVLVTESIYNFGPRKLMRILRFEGGILAYIETGGYGYHED